MKTPSMCFRMLEWEAATRYDRCSSFNEINGIEHVRVGPHGHTVRVYFITEEAMCFFKLKYALGEILSE